MVDFVGMEKGIRLSPRDVFQDRRSIQRADMIQQRVLHALAEEDEEGDRMIWARVVRGPGFDHTRESLWRVALHVGLASIFWLGIVFWVFWMVGLFAI